MRRDASFNLAGLPALPISRRRELPESSAIYIVLSATGQILYVGSTRNLRRRWRSHALLDSRATYTDLSLVWMLLADDDLLEIEHALIWYLGPLLNKDRRDHLLFLKSESEPEPDYSDDNQLTGEQIREQLKAEVERAGSQKAFAQTHDIDPAVLSNVLRGRRDLPTRILDALGLRRVVLYEHWKRP